MRTVVIAHALLAAALALPLAWGQQADSTGHLAASAQAPGERTLRIITSFTSPPFSFKKGLKEEGFDIDLGEAVGKELGAKVEWVRMTFDVPAYAKALDEGRADAAMAGITITDGRRKLVAFTRPYFRTGLAVAVKDTMEWDHESFARKLKGWSVGVMRGTTGEKWARANLDAKIETYPSLDSLITAIRNSKIPRGAVKEGFCAIHDQAVLMWAHLRYGSGFRVAEYGITREDYGIAVRKDNAKLLEDFNAALEKLDREKVCDKIREKWYGRMLD
ncbi:MAG: ABC transporter substrate-binding protein [Chlamydiota bacterium]